MVSIHTPIQGVTLHPNHFAESFLRFNPHTHTGCDPSVFCSPRYLVVSIHTPIQGVTSFFRWYAQGIVVSIHTPIQGVTIQPQKVYATNCCFNPHTHTGCDYLVLCLPVRSLCFNPHTHTGCDWKLAGVGTASTSFNPHTHTGCDGFAEGDESWEFLFQSTHPYRV